MRRQADAEMDSANTAADKLRIEANRDRVADQSMTQKLNDRFKEIDDIGDEQTRAFQTSLDDAKNLISALAGEEYTAMAGLHTRMDEMQEDMKAEVAKGQTEDDKLLRDLLADVMDDAGEKKKSADDAQAKIDAVVTKVEGVEDRTAKAQDMSRHQADQFQVQVATRARQLSKRLKEEELARKRETNAVKVGAQLTGDELHVDLGRVSTLTRKVTAGTEYQYGTVDLEEQKLARRIAEALAAAQHGDEQAIKTLKAELKEENARTNKLLQWKMSVEKNGRRFQHLVQKEFRKLGEELDMTSIEEAEQHAMEQWAVQEQENHLKQVLGEELEKLSDHGATRLAALAKRQGEKMTAILNNATATDEERAARLHKLKEESRKHATRVLEEDGRLQLDQRTSARKLKIATKEIQKATGVIASLEGSAAGRGVEFGSTIGRVRDLIDDANMHILRYPDEGGETNASVWNVSLYDTPNTTTSTATGAALLEEGDHEVSDSGAESPGDVTDLFQAAVASGYSSIDEDKQMLEDLRNLEKKLPHQKL